MSKTIINRWMLIVVILATGCTNQCTSDRKSLTPEQVVQNYLDLSLNMTDVSQKPEIINLTIGNLREALEQASDDLLTDAFINKNYHLEQYSIIERRDRTPRETEITFMIVYRDLGKDRKLKPEQAPKVMTENTVALLKYKGAWAIHDVLGKKTSIDFPLPDKGEDIRPSSAQTRPPEAESSQE